MIIRDGDRLSILNIYTLPPHLGGSAFSNAELVMGLAKLGHHVQAISPITPEKFEQEKKVPSWNFDGLHIERIVLDYLSPSIPPTSDYRKVKGDKIREAFDRLLKRSRPDIVIMGRESFAWHPLKCAGDEVCLQL